MNYLSACAIVKNEASYLFEWIKYHSALGIENFYIYQNDSTDATSLRLRMLANKYSIHIINFPGEAAQMPAYTQCLDRFKNDSQWIAFIDIDEFIVSAKPLKDFLKDYEGYAGVAAHWYLFGSNGWQVEESQYVVERFTKRQKEVNPHIKCIVNPHFTVAPFTPHTFIFRERLLVDENFERIPEKNPIPEGGTANLIQINHYATKSYEECMKRRSRPRADTGTTRNAEEFFAVHDRNDVEDFRARDFWRSIG